MRSTGVVRRLWPAAASASTRYGGGAAGYRASCSVPLVVGAPAPWSQFRLHSNASDAAKPISAASVDEERFIAFAAAQPRYRYTTADLLTAANPTVTMEEWTAFVDCVRREVLVGLASLCHLVSDGPLGLWTMPSMRMLRKEYADSVVDLRGVVASKHVDNATKEVALDKALRSVIERHRPAAERIADALREFVTAKETASVLLERSSSVEPGEGIDHSLFANPQLRPGGSNSGDDVERGRKGATTLSAALLPYRDLQAYVAEITSERARLRLLIAHYLRCREHRQRAPSGEEPSTTNGHDATPTFFSYGVPHPLQHRGVLAVVRPIDIVRYSASVARSIAQASWAATPAGDLSVPAGGDRSAQVIVPDIDLKLQGNCPDLEAVVVASTFFHVITAVLSHCLQQSCLEQQKSSATEPKRPPAAIEVLVCQSIRAADVTIRITDPNGGGGVPFPEQPMALDFLYTAVKAASQKSGAQTAATPNPTMTVIPDALLGWSSSSIRVPYAAVATHDLLQGCMEVAHVEADRTLYYVYVPVKSDDRANGAPSPARRRPT